MVIFGSGNFYLNQAEFLKALSYHFFTFYEKSWGKLSVKIYAQYNIHIDLKCHKVIVPIIRPS